ncbi:MAG TPA: hypothetical protein VFU72_12640 [Nitrolancea sp.]|nr:hypothetical protein [Nitrolancea sp.]
MADPPTTEHAWAFWVFDRPLHRDWLVLAGLAAGVAFAVWTLVRPGRPPALVLAYELFWALPGGVMAAGVVGGTIRELFRTLRRARDQDRDQDRERSQRSGRSERSNR